MNTPQKYITKKTIIKALETEPLGVGRWVNLESCEVCAVGAVLRKALNVGKLNITEQNYYITTKSQHLPEQFDFGHNEYVIVEPYTFDTKTVTKSLTCIKKHAKLSSPIWLTLLSSKFESKK